jgi:hypothetical protein
MGVWESIFKALASMRDLSRVSVDSTTVEAKKGGGLVRYDGFKNRKGSKIHDPSSMPLYFTIMSMTPGACRWLCLKGLTYL